MRRTLLVAALASCLDATALRVDVTSEVDCGLNAPVSIVVANDLNRLAAGLESGAVSSSRAGCMAPDGTVGSVVLTPASSSDEPVAFAVMTRKDGLPSDMCGSSTLAAADRGQCIVAKRGLRFSPHHTMDVRVDLRVSCAGVACPSDETCVMGQCVGAACPPGDCGESTLGSADGGAPASHATAIAAGGDHTCALLADGSMQCWGDDSHGMLGDNALVNRGQPGVVPGVTAQGLGAGNFDTCAVTSNAGVTCWGWNFWGEVGDGTLAQRLVPTTVPALSGVRAVWGGLYTSCALLGDGTLRCWGDNAYGELGDGTMMNRSAPTPVPGLAGVTSVALSLHSCAVLSDATLWCWGDNSMGPLGDGTKTARPSPTKVTGLTAGATSVTAGAAHTCATLVGGAVECWGDNSFGQVGGGATAGPQLTPKPVGGITATALCAGVAHTCALLVDGSVSCWGNNTSGQLGDGTTTLRLFPQPVPGLSNVAALACGNHYTCALKKDGSVLCWGQNAVGELGNGGMGTNALSPTPVGLP